MSMFDGNVQKSPVTSKLVTMLVMIEENMLVTSCHWQLQDIDHFGHQHPLSLYMNGDQFTPTDIPKMSSTMFNIKIQSPTSLSPKLTSKSCHQLTPPISVINIDVGRIELKPLCPPLPLNRRINDCEWRFSYSDPIRVKSNGILTQVQNVIDWQQDSVA